jgi:hypothetical protein
MLHQEGNDYIATAFPRIIIQGFSSIIRITMEARLCRLVAEWRAQ